MFTGFILIQNCILFMTINTRNCVYICYNHLKRNMTAHRVCFRFLWKPQSRSIISVTSELRREGMYNKIWYNMLPNIKERWFHIYVRLSWIRTCYHDYCSRFIRLPHTHHICKQYIRALCVFAEQIRVVLTVSRLLPEFIFLIREQKTNAFLLVE